MKNKKSEEEIREFFVKRYGEWILRAPPKQGFNLVLWILPGTGILIGLMWIVFRSKRWKEDKNNDDLPQLTPEEEQKLKEDLWRFEKS